MQEDGSIDWSEREEAEVNKKESNNDKPEKGIPLLGGNGRFRAVAQGADLSPQESRWLPGAGS